MPFDVDVYFGDVTKEINWRDPEFEDLSPDDDEELMPTPSDVVDMLGFDPRDEDVAKAGYGIMIAWFPPKELADKLAQEGGEKPEELHVTLAYLGKQEAFTDDQVELLKDTVEEYCKQFSPLQGMLGGNGRFPATPSSDDKDVLIKMVDVAMLEKFREELIEELADKGIPIVRNHGYTPHMTLAYVDPDYTGECTHPDTEDIVIDALTVAIGGERHVYPLNGEEVLKSNSCHVPSGPAGGQFCEIGGGSGKVSTTVQWLQSLTQEESRALSAWAKPNEFNGLNARLRNQEITTKVPKRERDRYEQDVLSATTLDSAIGKSSLPRDRTVYRGITGTAAGRLVDAPVGTTFSDKGFVSTSSAKNVAQRFAENWTAGGPNVVIQIALKRGQRGASMDTFASQHNKTEHEILLPRNLTFKIVAKRQEKYRYTDMTVVDVEVL